VSKLREYILADSSKIHPSNDPLRNDVLLRSIIRRKTLKIAETALGKPPSYNAKNGALWKEYQDRLYAIADEMITNKMMDDYREVLAINRVARQIKQEILSNEDKKPPICHRSGCLGRFGSYEISIPFVAKRD
jgi:hypothetical protein